MDIRIVDGRLTKDAEIKKTTNGIKYLSFTLANNGFAKGEKVTKFFNVVSYDPYTISRQENDKFYNKGKLVVVSGRSDESLSIKDSKTYLNRNIIANSIELGTYSSSNKEENQEQKQTYYRDVAPAVPNAAPAVPTVEYVPPTPTFTTQIEQPYIPTVEAPFMQQQTNGTPDMDDDLPF